MKRFYLIAFLIAISLFSVVVFSSCEEEELKPSIVFTDTPPENLFGSNLDYATSDKIWVDANSMSSIKIKGSGCLYWTDENGNSTAYNCGDWRIFQSRKYWGMLNGIHYVSNSMDWYTLNEEMYHQVRDLIEKRGVLICHIWLNGRTPWGNTVVVSEYN